MTEYFGEFGQQVKASATKAQRVLVALVGFVMVAGVLVAGYGLASATHIVKPDQATALGLFHGKAAGHATTLILNQVTDCGAQTGTILSLSVLGPPLKVTSDKLGSNPSLTAPGPGGLSEVQCLAAKNLNNANAQTCAALALTGGGSATVEAKSFAEAYDACMSAYGAS